MTIEVRWGAYDTLVTLLTGEMSLLGNASSTISAAIDFTAAGVDRKQYMDVEATITTVDLSTQVNPALYFWLAARTDGSNFEDGGTATVPARQPDGIAPLRSVLTAQQKVFVRLLLTTPDQAKLVVQNKTGAALNSGSGNTIKYYTYGDELV